MMTGCIALVAGAAITFGAVAASSAVAFLVGTGVAGIGVGLAFLGSFRVLSALASPGQRASLFSVIFIASYTAFSIPVVIAGVATSHFGLHLTALVYSAVIAALVGLALLSLLLRGRAPDGTFATFDASQTEPTTVTSINDRSVNDQAISRLPPRAPGADAINSRRSRCRAYASRHAQVPRTACAIVDQVLEDSGEDSPCMPCPEGDFPGHRLRE